MKLQSESYQRERYQTFSTRHQSGGTKLNIVIGLFIAAALFIVSLAIFPPTYSTDLTLIGQGKPAIAIVYDVEDGYSVELKKNFSAVRDDNDYEDLLEFLIIDVRSPNGRDFLRKNPATQGSALFYSGAGEKVLVIEGPREASVLRDSIQQAFGF